jgi:predicted nucleic acid-binding Zn ribbon protein
MQHKFCLQCGEPLKGRADKKFCDDQCRTTYNNNLKSEAIWVREINITLRRNRKIIEELIPINDGKLKTTKVKLTDKGFNFTYHTHTYTTKAGATYIFCYEYGYLPLEGDLVMLVKRENK